VLLGDPSVPGGFLNAAHYPAGAGSRAVIAADFDRDGRLDLATGNQNANTATVLRNETPLDIAGYALERVSLGTPSGSSGGAGGWPADFNEDGQLDVLTQPDWTITGRVLHVLITGGATVTLPVTSFMSGFAAADFNNDSHVDVMVWQGYDTVVISVYFGDGRGGFTRAPETTSPLRFWNMDLGDFTRDGVMDLIFSGYDPSMASNIIQLMLGVGDGTFRPGAKIPADEFVSVPRAADINRDGKLDVGAFLKSALYTWHGDGAGGLVVGSATSWPYSRATAFEFGDLNRDGFLDAVVVAQDRINVAFGRSDGFIDPGPPIVMIRSNGPAIAVTDFTMDGKLDVVTNEGMLLRGAGDGTFAPPDLFAYFGSAGRLHTADFNRDGLPDLFVAPTHGAVDVILNRRGHVNEAPVIVLDDAVNIEYAEQFREDGALVPAMASDPDLHALRYEWRDEKGELVESYGPLLAIRGKTPGTYNYTLTVFDDRGGSATDTLAVNITPMKEIVLHAARWNTAGNWSRVEDTSAASGARVYDKNLGAPKVTAPVAQPANRVSIGFIADPTQTYKLWIRLKADGNSWSNDSVWVQFSGAVDGAGAPAYRTGTTSGLAVNLEECAGCGIDGWGWEDDGWGAVDRAGVTLKFPAGGYQSLDIQTREDGVSIDQIVLSSGQYLTKRPGTAKNDATILNATYWPEYE
jgi:hypothetical protein